VEDVHLAPYHGLLQGEQYGPNKSDSLMLIDATRKRAMPPLALPTREHMQHARALWEELGLPPLTVQSPWHGYTLDDWTENWETFARRAAAGDWEITGRETFARQRDGLTPETSVRVGERE
jgi:4-hydroxy-3-polyprenylbenzoate decarboxylase